jgi:hypothetical protein
LARADNIDKGGNVANVRSQTEVGSACTGRCHFFEWFDFIQSRPMNRKAKAALKSPQSRRFATSVCTWQTRERLDCGGFSAAFPTDLFLPHRDLTDG